MEDTRFLRHIESARSITKPETIHNNQTFCAPKPILLHTTHLSLSFTTAIFFVFLPSQKNNNKKQYYEEIENASIKKNKK